MYTDTGLKKGVLRFEGIGPDKTWTITHAGGRVYDVWEIFKCSLPDFMSAKLFRGDSNVLIKGSYWGSDEGVRLDSVQVSRFLKGENFKNKYLREIIAHVSEVMVLLNRKKVRLENNLSKFSIVGEQYHEWLKGHTNPNAIGLFRESTGCCRIYNPLHSTQCKVGKEGQCIFLIEYLEQDGCPSKGRYVCGKYLEPFASKAMVEHQGDLKRSGQVGTCSPLRGIEVW